ncbi:hypothetical protein HanRHA438_Chr08g0341461 [Helianthus annuus]|nr:hypothetical protein HanRHA438_Chr08g0341461 [Helianthus annuus]
MGSGKNGFRVGLVKNLFLKRLSIKGQFCSVRNGTGRNGSRRNGSRRNGSRRNGSRRNGTSRNGSISTLKYDDYLWCIHTYL